VAIREIDVNPVKKCGTFESNKFSIALTAHAFNVLSSSLYSNKIRAILRELGCNAVDAHKAAGNQEPFIVHLPNQLEPCFAVRDFGISMSHETIMGLYSTYFTSGDYKLQSNDFIGCYGLGSKSPLSYIDSFEVVAYGDGQKRLYVCNLDSEGIPEISHINTEPSDEPRGLEVRFPVKTQDFQDFYDEAGDVFSYFDIKPTLRGYSRVKIIEPKHTILGTNWAVRERDSHGPQVIVGGVAYKVNRAQINFSAVDVDIFAPIGSVDITPSRETLRYTKKTILYIEQVVKDIISEINSKIQDSIKNAPSLWDARCIAADAWNNTYKYLYGYESGKFKFAYGDTTIRADEVIPTGGTTKRLWRVFHGYKLETSRHISRISPTAKAEFYYVDIPTGYLLRCQEYIENHRDKIVYLVEYEDEAAFKNLLGGPDILPVSSLPAASQRTYSGGGVTKGQVFKLVGGYTKFESSYWNPVELKDLPSDEYLYVELNMTQPIMNGIRIKASYLFSIIKGLATLGIKIPTVCGVRKKALKILEADDRFIPAYDYIKESIASWLQSNNPAQEYANQKYIDNFNPYYKKFLEQLASNTIKHPDVLDLVRRYKLLMGPKTQKINTLENYSWILDFFGHRDIIYNTKPQVTLDDAESVFAQFPMLGFAINKWSLEPEDINIVVDYINTGV